MTKINNNIAFFEDFYFVLLCYSSKTNFASAGMSYYTHNY